jgi:di- and tripeptidase
VTNYKNKQYFITGANDDNISIWSIDSDKCNNKEKEVSQASDSLLLSSLREFVSYKTVSSRPEFAEDCRKGATYLGALFKRLGGDVELLSTEKHHNPVVYARFSAKKETTKKRKQILFYGHYDVVAADSRKGKWESDPFTMQGINGYLYGRGVSDNKGPIIAALYAVTDLMENQQLEKVKRSSDR